jgi:GTP cyclohydrolase IA
MPERKCITKLLKFIGENPEREGLQETPDRYIKALEFWTSGYGLNPDKVLKTFSDGAEKYDQMIFQGGIPLFSLCEHHIVPFFGIAHIGYIPDRRIVGLSKLARVVEIYARRLQCQERLTQQIADALWNNLKPKAVGVVIRCRHLCMESRGVQKIGTTTTTSALHGTIKDESDCRAEFMSMVTTADSGTRAL